VLAALVQRNPCAVMAALPCWLQLLRVLCSPRRLRIVCLDALSASGGLCVDTVQAALDAVELPVYPRDDEWQGMRAEAGLR
jgi:hypothetical protein